MLSATQRAGRSFSLSALACVLAGFVEFESQTGRAQPVHVFDGRNLRLTVVAADLSLSKEGAVPFPAYLVTPLEDGRLYAVQWWTPSPERVGLPVHIIHGREVTRSFGVAEGEYGDPEALTPFTARRVLATGPFDSVFSAKYYEYSIEHWSKNGSREAVFEGPRLNDRPVQAGPWPDDNPPANQIRDIHLDSAGQLWLTLHYRRPEWRERMVERVTPDGRVGLQFEDPRLTSYYRSRIDVVDLSSCSLIAGQWHEGYLLTFVEDGIISELHHGIYGTPSVNIWRVTIRQSP